MEEVQAGLVTCLHNEVGHSHGSLCCCCMIANLWSRHDIFWLRTVIAMQQRVSRRECLAKYHKTMDYVIQMLFGMVSDSRETDKCVSWVPPPPLWLATLGI